MKIISQTPLRQLWTEDGVVDAQRGRKLTIADIMTILRSGPALFVVASVGCPPEWIPIDQCFHFWKSVKKNITDEDRFRLEDYPGEIVYTATEWNTESGELIICLEMHH